MRQWEWEEVKERDERRRLELAALLNETIFLLRKVQSELERKEVLSSYRASVKNLYDNQRAFDEVEEPKGSLGK